MFRFCTAANLPEAYLLLHRLSAAGIEARVLNEHAQGGMGEIPFTQTYPEIWIMQESDGARAREIIAALEQAPASRRALRCQACAEINPPGFEICWQCGRVLD